MMRKYVLPMALLFIAFTAPTTAQKRGPEEAPTELAVREGEPLSVTCALRVEQRAAWAVQRAAGGAWGAPAADLAPAAERALPDGRLQARLVADRARAVHAGLYRCHPDAAPVRLRLLPPAAGDAVADPTERSVLAAPPAAPAAPSANNILYYNLRKPLRLNCTTGAAKYTWTKNGTELDVGKDAGGPKLENNGAVLAWEVAREEDYGNYSCSADGAAGGAWQVHARAVMRLPRDSNVVEGQKLTLACKPHGLPLQPVAWYYAPLDSVLNLENVTELMGQITPLPMGGSEPRFTTNVTDTGVEGGLLELKTAAPTDAGQYLCVPEEGVAGVTALRVKDVYAALWPFLGICAEVFVLCAVILLYEKRRTKPEMEDSDADAHDN